MVESTAMTGTGVPISCKWIALKSLRSPCRYRMRTSPKEETRRFKSNAESAYQ